MQSRVRTLLDVQRHGAAIATVLIAALVGLAWHNRFIQDDAFISFRYAQHLTQGLGLVWNPGEWVEGYTNFLWTILIAAGTGLGLEPIGVSFALGLAAFAGTLALTHALALRVFGSGWLALAAVFLLGTNYTFSAYATGGLETQLQATLLVAAMFLCVRLVTAGERPRGWAILSLVAAAGVMTRMDSALILGPIVLVALRRALREPGAARWRTSLLLLGPGGLLVGTWLAWKLAVYGSLLPNTYYAKTGQGSLVALGLRYVGGFVQAYALWFPAVLLPLAIRQERGTPRRTALALLALSLVWLGYVAAVGGDFMEYRFVVPITPFLMILVARACFAGTHLRVFVPLVLTGLSVASWLHARTSEASFGRGMIEPIAALNEHVTKGTSWAHIGRALGDVFARAEGKDVVIATTASGAIPYYSELETIDMLGLNDAWIARNGFPLERRPGHQTITSYGYLVERGVHVVVSHPILVDRRTPARPTYTLGNWDPFAKHIPDVDSVPRGATLIEIPINEKRSLLALYLTRHRRIERGIREEGWRVHRLPGS